MTPMEKSTSMELEKAIDRQESRSRIRPAMEKLPDDPKRGAEEIVREAKDRYHNKDYKEFRYWVIKEFEKDG